MNRAAVIASSLCKIGQLGSGRENLQLHSGSIHHLKARRQFIGTSAAGSDARNVRAGSAAAAAGAHAVEHVEILDGKDVPVNVDSQPVRRAGNTGSWPLSGKCRHTRQRSPGRQRRDTSGRSF